jgi:hypothetical protein
MLERRDDVAVITAGVAMEERSPILAVLDAERGIGVAARMQRAGAAAAIVARPIRASFAFEPRGDFTCARPSCGDGCGPMASAKHWGVSLHQRDPPAGLSAPILLRFCAHRRPRQMHWFAEPGAPPARAAFLRQRTAALPRFRASPFFKAPSRISTARF